MTKVVGLLVSVHCVEFLLFSHTDASEETDTKSKDDSSSKVSPVTVKVVILQQNTCTVLLVMNAFSVIDTPSTFSSQEVIFFTQM